MTKPVRKKLIEVSIPLESINAASAREKSIRHGHPSTLHLWWARRPLAACRAVLFAQLVDDPSSWPDRFPTEEAQDAERRRLHKVIEAMVPWEASNNEPILSAARWEIARSVAWGFGEEPPERADGPAILDYLQTKAPPVYDPFSGGGSIPLEAQRLGLRAYGSDLNPVAVLIGKALVEIPPKFAGRPPVNLKARAEAANGEVRGWKGAQGLAEDVRYYGQWMRAEAEKRIGQLYPKATLPDGSKATVIAWLWARTVRSPDPAAKGAMVPLVSSFMLSLKEGKKAWIEIRRDAAAPDSWCPVVHTGLISAEEEKIARSGTKTGRGSFACVLSGSVITPAWIKAEARAGRLGSRLLAIVAEGVRERVYLSADAEQERAARVERPAVAEVEQAMSHDPRAITPVLYDINSWDKLYSDRQLLAMETFSNLAREAREQVLTEAGPITSLPDLSLERGGDGVRAYADAVATYLSFAVSRLSNLLNNLCQWRSDAGKQHVGHMFARQAVPMVWDYAEANPLASSAGSWEKSLFFIPKVLEDLPVLRPGAVQQADAARQLQQPSVFATDPPYYDNVGYADLSDFFYGWSRRALKSVWPELFRRLQVPKEEELVAAPHRDRLFNESESAELRLLGSRDRAERYFLRGMSATFRSMAALSIAQAPISIFYAFKQSELEADGLTSAGWATFIQAVLDAGWSIDGTWPLRTELGNRMRGQGANALASSIVLVCRKRRIDAPICTRADFMRDLKREMPAAIDAIRKAGVGPVDMQQSIIGPGMGVFSRHARVLEDDDSAMSVKTALALINRVWEEIENELDQAFDAATQVALAWFAAYGFDARASGELITLTTAKNTSDRALFASGVFKDMKGKAGLTPREELSPSWSPAGDKLLTTWECVQHTARVLNASDGGGEAAAALVAQMGPKSEEARALAYRLFEIATNKGWAAEALVYNELAQEWTRLEDVAATLDDAGRAPGSNQTAFTFGGTA